MISDPVEVYTLFDIVIADPTRRDSVDRGAEWSLVAAEDVEWVRSPLSRPDLAYEVCSFRSGNPWRAFGG